MRSQESETKEQYPGSADPHGLKPDVFLNVIPDLKVGAIGCCPLSHICHFEGAKRLRNPTTVLVRFLPLVEMTETLFGRPDGF